jgi:hypothetical protein
MAGKSKKATPGRPRTKTAHGHAQQSQLLERRAVVRGLLVECVPEWQIRRQLTEGFKIPDPSIAGGYRIYEPVSVSTAQRVLKDVADEFRGLFDDADHVEREIGAAFERLKRIADRAERAGKYTSAITANDRIIKLLAPRSKRWQHVTSGETPLAGGGSIEPPHALEGLPLAVGDAELADLARESGRLARQIERMGLTVIPGGAAEKKAAG